MPRKRPLSEFQQQFAREVAALNLASLDEAIAAFQRRDDAQIEEWKPAVQAERTRKRREYEEKQRAGLVVVKTEMCAWCSAPVPIKSYPGRLLRPEPVRRIHLSYDRKEQWLEQYGCCPEHERLIQAAQVVVTLDHPAFSPQNEAGSRKRPLEGLQ